MRAQRAKLKLNTNLPDDLIDLREKHFSHEIITSFRLKELENILILHSFQFSGIFVNFLALFKKKVDDKICFSSVKTSDSMTFDKI